MFADGRFFTPSGWARFIAIEDPVLAEPPDADFPFLLNTGRVRDQWHTMTRSLSPKLASHMPDPFVEVNPDDASKLGLAKMDSPGLARRMGPSCCVSTSPPRRSPAGSLFQSTGTTRWRGAHAWARLSTPSPIPTRGSRTRRPFRRRWLRFVSSRTALFLRAHARRCRATLSLHGPPSRAAMRQDLRRTSLSQLCSRPLPRDHPRPSRRATMIPREAFFARH
jgi:Molydopterin dinucleotide binding domain